MAHGAWNKALLGLVLGLACFTAAQADPRDEEAARHQSRAANDVWQLLFGKQALKEAEKQLGKPYIWGAKDGDKGFDCSGLTAFVYGSLGVPLAPNALGQYAQGAPIQKSGLQPGDLVFFNGQGSPLHVGIYGGSGRFIHAPGTGKEIQWGEVESSYFRNRFVGARRMAPPLASARRKKEGLPSALIPTSSTAETSPPKKEKAP
jgi:cell wall-associated NlpC family hydrolase